MKRRFRAQHKSALNSTSAWNSHTASTSISEEIREIVESTLLASNSSREEDLVGRLMNIHVPSGIIDRIIVLIQYVAASLAAIAPCCVLGMHPGPDLVPLTIPSCHRVGGLSLKATIPLSIGAAMCFCGAS